MDAAEAKHFAEALGLLNLDKVGLVLKERLEYLAKQPDPKTGKAMIKRVREAQDIHDDIVKHSHKWVKNNDSFGGIKIGDGVTIDEVTLNDDDEQVGGTGRSWAPSVVLAGITVLMSMLQ